ncbi:MAG: hypothetical protein L0Z55_05495 [Planctomycetes bacterium]|nr:hypothetical protein [Planctomycetota bacterium]
MHRDSLRRHLRRLAAFAFLCACGAGTTGCGTTHGSLEAPRPRTGTESHVATWGLTASVRVEFAELPALLLSLGKIPDASIEMRDDDCSGRFIAVEFRFGVDDFRGAAGSVGYRLQPAFDGVADYILVANGRVLPAPAAETWSFTIAGGGPSEVTSFDAPNGAFDPALFDALCALLSDDGVVDYVPAIDAYLITDEVEHLLAVEEALAAEDKLPASIALSAPPGR